MAQSLKQLPFFKPSFLASLNDWNNLSQFNRDLWDAWSRAEKTRVLDLRNTIRTGSANFQLLGTNKCQWSRAHEPFTSPPSDPAWVGQVFMPGQFTVTAEPLVRFVRSRPSPATSWQQMFFQMPEDAPGGVPPYEARWCGNAQVPAGGAAGENCDVWSAEFAAHFYDLWGDINQPLKVWLFEYSEGQTFYLGGWETVVQPGFIPQMTIPDLVAAEGGGELVYFELDGNSYWSVEIWRSYNEVDYDLQISTGVGDSPWLDEGVDHDVDVWYKTRWAVAGNYGEFSPVAYTRTAP
jgi:hypothetical protein